MRVKWLAVVVGLVLSGVAWGQVSYEEAMRRLRERQEQRAREAATNPAVTQPSTRPVAATTTRAATRRVARPLGTRVNVVGEDPPAAPREFRGVWVASVENANWPSKVGLSVGEQRGEMNEILEKCARIRANAIVLQVRPCADALYPSEIEPWSEYLTGEQGKDPGWDPLAEWVEGAHKRGMELHAWFNPYRVHHFKSKREVSEKSIAKTNPAVVKSYGGYLWMDPGEEGAEKQTLAVIEDIVKRYDVDGVHTDDYYYPYQVRENDKLVEFPDDASWEKYKAGGGKLARNDWRRDNVNRLVEKIYASVKGAKPWVKVGYAPFGIWKSGVPAGIKGLSMYDALYADAKLWLNKGWCDYMSPQLYWKIGGDQDYERLLKWWVGENTEGRHVWPGLSVGRHPVEEVERQIGMTREVKGSTAGVMLWSVNSVLKRAELYEAMGEEIWDQGALVPALAGLGKGEVGKPEVSVRGNLVEIKGEAKTYGVWMRGREGWVFAVSAGGEVKVREGVTSVVVTAVDRVGNESERVRVEVK